MPRIGPETFGEALAGSDRPFVLASGLLGLAPGRVATERDGHRPDSGAAPLIGGAQTRLATAQMVLSLASRGVRSSVMRLPPTVHVVVMLDWNLPDGVPSDTPDYLRYGMRGPVHPVRWSGSTRAFLAPRARTA
jgi:hypothetical protein